MLRDAAISAGGTGEGLAVPLTPWRYWLTYSGTVEAETEDEAIKRAQDDVDNGKLPEIEVEQEGEGE